MEKRQSFSSYEFVKDPSPSVKIDTSNRTKIKIKGKKRIKRKKRTKGEQNFVFGNSPVVMFNLECNL
jgi:hypothetical protein